MMRKKYNCFINKQTINSQQSKCVSKCKRVERTDNSKYQEEQFKFEYKQTKKANPNIENLTQKQNHCNIQGRYDSIP